MSRGPDLFMKKTCFTLSTWLGQFCFIRAALCNGDEVVFRSPLEGKLRLPCVKYEEIWKETRVLYRIVSLMLTSKESTNFLRHFRNPLYLQFATRDP